MSLPSQGSVSFSSGIPCSDLNMSPVSGCLSSDATSSCSCKLSYIGISYAPGENVNPSSSQGSQSLPCDTTSSGPSISALPACLSSEAFVSPCKLAHFQLCPAHSGNINPAHCGDINPAHCGEINSAHSGDINPTHCGNINPAHCGNINPSYSHVPIVNSFNDT